MVNDNYCNKVNLLSEDKQLLLALSYAERHQQVIKSFDDFYNESLSKQFADKLEMAYDLLLNKATISNGIIRESLAEIEKILPDSEDYPEIQGGLAQDGLIILCYCYRYILNQKNENIIYALNLSFETMNQIYSVNNDYLYEKEWQKEYAILDNYLEILNEISIIDSNAMVLLRKMSLSNLFVYKE